MKKIFGTALLLSLFPGGAFAWDTPTMGWSSWNSFGHRINEEIIRSQADAMAKTGLKDAGYLYVNLDDGAWCGREDDGKLRIHPTRFPNGLKGLVDYIHSLGLKAGTYSDAGHDTCASFWGGDKDGVGTGLYEHDLEDAQFMFNELGFDFIKVDFCGGDGSQNSEHLDLDERERYTAISEAIKATGRDDIRYNVCRWAYPGTWVEDVATSWRMSQDIYDGWESVKDIIHQNLYLSAYATKGRFNDMDMLEVGRSMSAEEDKTHFGMWCMMSSPLLIGCDLRSINKSTLDLLTNMDLVAINQDTLALQAQVVKRENGGYVLVKDLEKLHSVIRAVAFYNPTDVALPMNVSMKDLDLDGKVRVRDMYERKDIGECEGSLNVNVPPHATRIYRLEADRRLEKQVYEGETGRISAYQELDNNQVVKSGIYEEMDVCSGGAKVSWLGMRADNSLSWQDVWSEEGGDYEMTLYFITGADRQFRIDVNGKTLDELTVNSGGWDVVGNVTLTVGLQKGNNIITLSNDSDWMPDIDCMTLVKAGDLSLLRHRHKSALDGLLTKDLSSLPEKLENYYKEQITLQSVVDESREGFEASIRALSALESDIAKAVDFYASYSRIYQIANENVSASIPSGSLNEFISILDSVEAEMQSTINPLDYIDGRDRIEQEMKAYFSADDSDVKDGESWDMSCMIENPCFDTDNHGWQEEPVWGNHVAEFWNRSFSTTQTVTGLPAGIYKVGVQALYRVGENDGGVRYRTGLEKIPAVFIANDVESPIISLYKHKLSDNPELEESLSGTHVKNGYVNSMYGAEQAFQTDLYKNEMLVHITDGVLRLGLNCDVAKGDCWCCFDNYTLRYHGKSETSLDGIEANFDGTYTVFMLSGIAVGEKLSKMEIANLPCGLYIVNGHKVLLHSK